MRLQETLNSVIKVAFLLVIKLPSYILSVGLLKSLIRSVIYVTSNAALKATNLLVWSLKTQCCV